MPIPPSIKPELEIDQVSDTLQPIIPTKRFMSSVRDIRIQDTLEFLAGIITRALRPEASSPPFSDSRNGSSFQSRDIVDICNLAQADPVNIGGNLTPEILRMLIVINFARYGLHNIIPSTQMYRKDNPKHSGYLEEYSRAVALYSGNAMVVSLDEAATQFQLVRNLLIRVFPGIENPDFDLHPNERRFIQAVNGFEVSGNRVIQIEPAIKTSLLAEQYPDLFSHMSSIKTNISSDPRLNMRVSDIQEKRQRQGEF